MSFFPEISPWGVFPGGSFSRGVFSRSNSSPEFYSHGSVSGREFPGKLSSGEFCAITKKLPEFASGVFSQSQGVFSREYFSLSNEKLRGFFSPGNFLPSRNLPMTKKLALFCANMFRENARIVRNGRNSLPLTSLHRNRYNEGRKGTRFVT